MKQLTYKGHPTIRIRFIHMIESGLADQYTNDEIAELLDCNPRTIETYARDYIRSNGDDRPMERDEYTLPLVTRSGVKTCHYKGKDDCEKCEMLERCREMVKDGNFVACEVPLVKEVFGEREEDGEE